MGKTKKQPKIALFLPQLDIGGVERVMLNLATGFIKSGVSVDLVLVKAQGRYMRRIPTDVHVVNLGASRVLTSLFPLASYLHTVRPDGLISAKDYASVVALMAKFLARVSTRTIVCVHTTFSKHLQYTKSLKEKVIVPRLARWLYPYADAIVAVSNGVADDLAKFLQIPRERIHVIYNPVVNEDLFVEAQEPIDHPWFAPGAPPVIISIGRLTKAKDYSTLIAAFAKVRQRCDARLVILGEGEERARLQDISRYMGVEADVWLPGFVDPPYPYLARASVFVLSSIWEGLPTAIIEALALGVPVISTDCPGGSREILDNGRFGELVPVGDAEALADAILRALRAPHNPELLRTRAQQFSVHTAVAKYLAVLGFREGGYNAAGSPAKGKRLG